MAKHYARTARTTEPTGKRGDSSRTMAARMRDAERAEIRAHKRTARPLDLERLARELGATVGGAR